MVDHNVELDSDMSGTAPESDCREHCALPSGDIQAGDSDSLNQVNGP